MTEDPSRSAADLIDHDRYPIDDLSHPQMRALVGRCQADLRDHDVCVVHGFLDPEAMTRMVAEADEVVPQSYQRPGLRTCYLSSEAEPGWPEDHPRRRMLVHKTHILAYDQIREWTAIDRLYRWPPLRGLLAAILGKTRLYLHECPYQALNLLAFKEGDESSWHFDIDNEFTVTLLLRPADSGGEFEVAPKIRSRADPAYEEVQKVLDGDHSRVISVDRAPGSLVIFHGRNSLHRVSPVHGATTRLVAVMCYEPTPNVIGLQETNAGVYGPRVVALQGGPGPAPVPAG
jgi:hypothetical protein